MNANKVTDSFTAQAQASGPKDWLTRGAFYSNALLRLILMIPMLPLTIVTTLVGGLLVLLTFGLLLLPLSLIWMLFYGFLWSTSWLWIRAWYLRPFLLVPGVLVAAIAFEYVGLVPDMGEKYQKSWKLGLCESWPNSYLYHQLSFEHPEFTNLQ